MGPRFYGDLPARYHETVDAVVAELGIDADPTLVRRLALECFNAIGYFAPAGEGYPDADVATCASLETDICSELERAARVRAAQGAA